MDSVLTGFPNALDPQQISAESFVQARKSNDNPHLT